MDSTAITFDTCILCQQDEGRGTWQLRQRCRSNLTANPASGNG